MPLKLKNLTPIQIDCYNDQHRFIVTPAGRRSRKTLIFKRKLFNAALENKDNRYFQGAPTRQQAKSIFWKSLKENTKLFQAKAPNETELYVTLMNKTEIHVVGLDKPERVEGQPWDGCHITEIGNVKDGAWQESIRPALSDTKGFAYLDGVPEGRNHYYNMALKATDGAIPKTLPELGAMHISKSNPGWAYYSWLSADVLDEEEILAAKRDLDDKTYCQEYEGSYESFEGLAYYTYGQHNLALFQYDKNRIVSIGMDFNVDPMTCVIGHIIKDKFYQFGERYLINSNTYEMRDNLLETFNPTQVEIYPDSTGKARESNATESDLAILKKAGFTIKAHPSNPYVKDRINSVNSFVKNRNGGTRYKVNPETCPRTVNDFNRVERLEDGRLNKTQEEQGLKHITDGFGYLVSYKWPVKSREAYTITV